MNKRNKEPLPPAPSRRRGRRLPNIGARTPWHLAPRESTPFPTPLSPIMADPAAPPPAKKAFVLCTKCRSLPCFCSKEEEKVADAAYVAPVDSATAAVDRAAGVAAAAAAGEVAAAGLDPLARISAATQGVILVGRRKKTALVLAYVGKGYQVSEASPGAERRADREEGGGEAAPPPQTPQPFCRVMAIPPPQWGAPRLSPSPSRSPSAPPRPRLHPPPSSPPHLLTVARPLFSSPAPETPARALLRVLVRGLSTKCCAAHRLPHIVTPLYTSLRAFMPFPFATASLISSLGLAYAFLVSACVANTCGNDGLVTLRPL